MPVRLSQADFDRLRRKLPLLKKSKRAKFRSTKTSVGNLQFDSEFEAEHYKGLLARERAGTIRNLRCQVDFPLIVGKALICVYRSDFVYWEFAADRQTWIRRVVDTKSDVTRRKPDYRIKCKLMAALGNPITEVISKAWSRAKARGENPWTQRLIDKNRNRRTTSTAVR